ncbi:hypothetical protein VC83_02379 [Pseudogymnoascus destructans]|uniref:Benzoate 4-monooxygenase cytochrome P450 n=2 Tax=Pseudogymnoascus destructans TaxID=655981 RepID=L8FRR5_PSED2|nr:uncharacterized protein VC83_02379 [Pseudogymnoascus destructans]ELR03254.1 hypothetical protein GMDG_01237 [Pseudogymnoascus destructans 20631-21]OAF61146.1 hypothetical protein VC83_02379 [Pseudogymnoascus destructans]
MTASSLFSSISAWTSCLSTAAICWFLGVFVYRRWFHPLANIPGPTLAAVTYLYAFFFSNVGGSRYYAQIEMLHREYGPVIRITPDEIHLADPDNYETIYHVGSKYSKSSAFYRAFGSNSAAFTTASNELHRIRRAALNPLFSRKMVLQLEEVVQSKAQKLCRRLAEALVAGQPLDLHHGFRAVSVDVITDYAFDDCHNLLDRADFGVDFFAMVRGLGPAFWFFQQWPFIQPLALKTPMWLAKILSKPLRSFMQMQEDCRKQIISVKAHMDAGQDKSKSRTTMFYHLLNPDAAEGHVTPSVDELKDEAYIIIAAAADTTGNAMTIASYNIISNEAIYRKLASELREAFPDPHASLDFVLLERLPCLTAVIKEALRLSFGVIGRLPRLTPEPGAVFNEYAVPAGTIVGMSSWTMHRNENIFPSPDKFDPERWVDPEAARFLDKYLVPFGKGSRQCVGMPLAYCELYVTLGTVFRRFERLSVYETGPEDLVYDDYFSSYHPNDARRFHVVEVSKA